jgi:hypothetical protein
MRHRRSLPSPGDPARDAQNHNLTYYNKPGKGGHFAAWEQPQLFSLEVRGLQATPQIADQRNLPSRTLVGHGVDRLPDAGGRADVVGSAPGSR